MKMQNKLCRTQFLSPPDDWFTARPQAVIVEPGKLWILKLLKKTKLLDKRGFKLTEMRK